MRLNHVNLPVSDLGASKSFLETYFGLRCIPLPGSEPIVIMKDDDDCIITLSNFNDADAVVYPGAFHVGFMQRSREDVDAIHSRLKADGHATGTPKEFHGSWTFYLKAPGNFTIEVLGPMPGVVYPE